MANKWTFSSGGFGGGATFGNSTTEEKKGFGTGRTPSVVFDDLNEEQQGIYKPRYKEYLKEHPDDQDGAMLYAEEGLFTFQNNRKYLDDNGKVLTGGFNNGGARAPSIAFDDLQDEQDRAAYKKNYKAWLTDHPADYIGASVAGEDALRWNRMTPDQQIAGTMLDDLSKNGDLPLYLKDSNIVGDLLKKNGADDGTISAAFPDAGRKKNNDPADPAFLAAEQERLEREQREQDDAETGAGRRVQQLVAEKEIERALNEGTIRSEALRRQAENDLAALRNNQGMTYSEDGLTGLWGTVNAIRDEQAESQVQEPPAKADRGSGETERFLGTLERAGGVDAIEDETTRREVENVYEALTDPNSLRHYSDDQIAYTRGLLEDEITDNARYQELQQAYEAGSTDKTAEAAMQEERKEWDKDREWEQGMGLLNTATGLIKAGEYLVDLPERWKDLKTIGQNIWSGFSNATANAWEFIGKFVSGEYLYNLSGKQDWLRPAFETEKIPVYQDIRQRADYEQKVAQGMTEDMLERAEKNLVPVLQEFGVDEDTAKKTVSIGMGGVAGAGSNFGNMGWDTIIGVMTGGASVLAELRDITGAAKAGMAALNGGASTANLVVSGMKNVFGRPSTMPLAMNTYTSDLNEIAAEKGGAENLTSEDYWFAMADTIFNTMVEIGGGDVPGGVQKWYTSAVEPLSGMWGESLEEIGQNLGKKSLQNVFDYNSGVTPTYMKPFSVEDQDALICLAEIGETALQTSVQTLGMAPMFKAQQGLTKIAAKMVDGDKMDARERHLADRMLAAARTLTEMQAQEEQHDQFEAAAAGGEQQTNQMARPAEQRPAMEATERTIQEQEQEQNIRAQAKRPEAPEIPFVQSEPARITPEFEDRQEAAPEREEEPATEPEEAFTPQVMRPEAGADVMADALRMAGVPDWIAQKVESGEFPVEVAQEMLGGENPLAEPSRQRPAMDATERTATQEDTEAPEQDRVNPLAKPGEQRAEPEATERTAAQEAEEEEQRTNPLARPGEQRTEPEATERTAAEEEETKEQAVEPPEPPEEENRQETSESDQETVDNANQDVDNVQEKVDNVNQETGNKQQETAENVRRPVFGAQETGENARSVQVSGGSGGGVSTQKREAARKVSERIGLSAKEGEKGLTIRSWDGDTPDLTRLSELKTIDRYAKAHGVSVVMDDHIDVGDGRSANGYYTYKDKGGTAVVHIAQDSANPWRTVLGHELTHLIRANNAQGYGKMWDIFTRYAERAGIDLDALVKTRMKMYETKGGNLLGKTETEILTNAREEVLADAMFDVLGDAEAIRELAANDRTMMERIREWIERVTKELKDMLSGYTERHPEAKALQDQIGAMEEMRGAVEEALRDIDSLQDAKINVNRLGGNGRMTEKYQKAIREAGSRNAMNNATWTLTRELLGQMELPLTSDNQQNLIGAAVDFAAGGGTMSQSLKRYGISPKAQMTEEMNRAFALIGQYMQEMMVNDLDGFTEMMSREPGVKVVGNEDVKYSLEEAGAEGIDRVYMEAVESGDVEEQQRLVDLVARAMGYNPDVPLYHGTSNFGFTEFGTDVIFASTNKQVAAGYADPGWQLEGTESRYIDDHGDPEIIIRNAKRILSRNVKYLGDGEYKVEHYKDTFTEEELLDWIKNSKNSGIYKAYGNLGKKPLVINAKGNSWDNISIGGEKYTTDEIVKYGKDMGYTSVIIKNVLDPKRFTDYGDDYIFYHSSQLKTAEPVTHDDKGKVIPLSERFDTAKADIRWSVKEKPEAELKEAVKDGSDPAGQVEAARALAGKLLKEAGADTGKTSVDRMIMAGMYLAMGEESVESALQSSGFTEDDHVTVQDEASLRDIGEAVAEKLNAGDEDGYEAFFREDAVSVPEKLTDEEYEKQKQKAADKAKKNEEKNREKAERVREAMETIFSVTGGDRASLNLEDAMLQRLMDIRTKAVAGSDGKTTYETGGWKKGLQVAAEAFKSSMGLSKTAGTIGKWLSEIYEHMDALIQNGYGAHEVLASGLNRARELTQALYQQEMAGSGAYGNQLEDLKNFFKENAGTLYLSQEDWQEIRDTMGIRAFRQALAGIVNVRVDKSGHQAGTDIANYWNEGIGAIVGNEDAVNTSDMLECLYDAALRAKTPGIDRGMVTTAELDYLDQQAMNVVASYFTMGESAVRTEQAAEVQNQVKKQSEMIVSQQAEIDRLTEQRQQALDKLTKRLKELQEIKAQGVEGLEEARTMLKEAQESERAAREELQEANDKMSAYRGERNKLRRELDRVNLEQDALHEQLEKSRERLKKVREQAKKGLTREKLTRQIRQQGSKLRKMIGQPGEKNGFVPPELMRQTATLVQALIDGDGRKSAEAGKILSRQLLEAKTGNSYNLQTMFNDQTQPLLEEAVKILESKAAVKVTKGESGRTYHGLSQLSDEDLETVANAVTNVVYQLTTANEMIGREKNKLIFDEATDAIRQLNQNPKNPDRMRVFKKFMQEHLTPERFFNFLGSHQDNAITRAGTELKEGQRREEMLTMKGTKYFQGLTEKKNAKLFDQFTGKNAVWHDTGIRVLDQTGKETGRTMKLTGALRASLYMNWNSPENREAMRSGMKDENGGDLYQLTMPDEALLKKGRTQEAYQRGYRVYLTAGQVEQILDKTTAYEKQWCEAWKKAEKELFQEEINKTSMALNGFYVANVKDYYPISRDPGFIGKDFDTVVSDERLTSMGFLKSRVNAHNPMMLLDIADVCDRQIRSVAKYAGLAVPIRNFTRVYNAIMPGYSDSVKKAMARTQGTDAMQYLEKLMSDLQGGGLKAENTFLDRLRGKQAGAVLTGNMAVVIKQAASYPAAASVVGYNALAKAFRYFGAPKKIDVDLIDTYTAGFWLRRSQKMGDLEANANRNSAFSKGLHKLGNGIQGMDVLTTKVLWKAAEYWVNDNTNLKPGSQESVKNGTDAYYKKVAEVYERILEQTQPEYGTFQRPGILRSKNQLVKALTMYKTQSIQNFNILADAVVNLNDQRKAIKANPNNKEAQAAYRSARTQAARAVSSQIVSAVTLAVMTALGKALLHKLGDYRDDKGDLTPESIGQQLMKDSLSSMFGMVAGGSELFDFIAGLAEGKAPYDIEAGGISTLNDLYQNTFNLMNAASVIGDGSLSDDEKMKKLQPKIWKFAGSMAEMLGAPITNIRNLFDGIWANARDAALGKPLSFEESGLSFLGSAQGRETTNKAVAGYIARAMMDGDEAEAVRLYNEQLRQGKTADALNTAIASWQKENIPEIRQAAEAIERGDLSTYNSLINKLVKMGLSMSNAVKYVEAERKKSQKNDGEASSRNAAPAERLTYEQIVSGMTKEDTELQYTNSQMNTLLYYGDVDQAMAVRDEMLKSGKKQTSINSSLSSYWKPILQEAYASGNMEEVRRITDMLVKMGMKRTTITGWTGGVGSSTGFGSGTKKSSGTKKNGFGSGGFGSGGFGSGGFGSSSSKKSSGKKTSGFRSSRFGE